MKVLKIEQLINDLKEQDIMVNGIQCRTENGWTTLKLEADPLDWLHGFTYWEGIEDYIMEDNDNE